MSKWPEFMDLPPEFWGDREVLQFISEWKQRRCDIVDTLLCQHYRPKPVCHYGGTHGVEKCPYGKKLRYENIERL